MRKAEQLELREAVEALIDRVRKMHHNAALRCTYDDYGTGASGMSPKPCAEFRAGKDHTWWCGECRTKPLVERVEADLALLPEGGVKRG